jgi:hypothetical protein
VIDQLREGEKKASKISCLFISAYIYKQLRAYRSDLNAIPYSARIRVNDLSLAMTEKNDLPGLEQPNEPTRE